MRDFPPGLMLITDRRRAKRPLPEACRAALEAGFEAVMLREKDLPAGPLLELAAPLLALCAEFGRAFLVNDRLDVALALDGAGAHLGKASVPVVRARELLGPSRLLGYSAHEADEALEALRNGADYVTVSPIFPSFSKPDLKPRGLPFLEDAVRRLPRGRVVALGGIDAARIPGVVRAGAGGAAILGAVLGADDPAAAAGALMHARAAAGSWSRA